MAEITGTAFARWEVSPDGARVRMTITGADGVPIGVVLPAASLSTLAMTLPAIIEQSLRRQHRDPSLKLVYPLAGWSVEAAAGSGDLIVTMETPDGFKVAFAATPAELEEIGAVAAAHDPAASPLN